MIKAIFSICSLLLSIGILLAGSGMLSTLLGLRGAIEGFSEFTIGLVMSCFFAGYIVGSFLCPKLVRRVGHIRTFAALATVSVTAALLHGLFVDPWVWAGLRLVSGISLLGIYLVIESWLNDQVRHNRGKMFAVYSMISLGALGAGQFLIVFYGAEALESFAIVAILYALGLLPLALTRVPQPTLQDSRNLPLKELLAISHVGAIGSLVAGSVTGAFWGLSAVYALNVGLDNRGVASFIAATIVGGALLQWPIGHLSDRHDRRLVMAWVALCAAATALLIFALADVSLSLLTLCAVLLGGFIFTLYPLSVSQTHDRIDSGDTLPATRGLLLLNGIGSTLGPLLVGLLMQLSSARLFPVILGGILVLLAVYTRRRIRRNPTPEDAQRQPFVALSRTSEAVLEMDPRSEPEPELEFSARE